MMLTLALSLTLAGCKSKSYGTEGCRQNQPEPIADFSVTDGKTDVTFIAFGDTQEGGGAADKNDIQIDAINAFHEHLTWEDAGRADWGDIDNVRGIIMAGDITQNGRDGRGFETDEYGGSASGMVSAGTRRFATGCMKAMETMTSMSGTISPIPMANIPLPIR